VIKFDKLFRKREHTPKSDRSLELISLAIALRNSQIDVNGRRILEMTGALWACLLQQEKMLVGDSELNTDELISFTAISRALVEKIELTLRDQLENAALEIPSKAA